MRDGNEMEITELVELLVVQGGHVGDLDLHSLELVSEVGQADGGEEPGLLPVAGGGQGEGGGHQHCQQAAGGKANHGGVRLNNPTALDL